MEIPNLQNVPVYLEANTKEDLMALMWANNHLNGRAFNYMSPTKDGKKWVVWFYADVENWIKPEPKDMVRNVEIR